MAEALAPAAVAALVAIRASGCSPADARRARVPTAGCAGVWVFARAGCGACERHLAALARARAALTGAAAALEGRVYIVGDVPAPIPEARTLPASLRRAFGVRPTPTTWLVTPQGRVHESWLGARGEASWERALAWLLDAGAEP